MTHPAAPSAVTILALALVGLAGNAVTHRAPFPGVNSWERLPAERPAPGARPEVRRGQHNIVELDTTLGKIRIELDSAKAPVATKNFLEYVNSGYYNGTIFHRVIPGFMIQGGGFTPDMTEKQAREPIRNEGGNGLSNTRGTISMARTADPDSATSQFFINVKDNAQLDRDRCCEGSGYAAGYAVFGRVVSGMDVADKIVDVKTTTKGVYEDVPKDPVLIRSAKVITR
jgi:peptidyl-prolyl cis-trans isomerase A (cyclophilin A)